MSLDYIGSQWDRKNRNTINKMIDILRGFDGKQLYEDSYNLFNKKVVVPGLLGGSTGTVHPSDTYVVSEYIPVQPNNYIMIGPTAGITVIYDSNFSYVGEISGVNAYPYLLPDNARYLRTTTNKNNVDTKMVYYGTKELPYEPYGIKWTDGIFDDEMFDKIQEGLDDLADVQINLRNFIQQYLEGGIVPRYENLFDPTTVVSGVIGSSTGNLNPSETFVSSDYIQVIGGEYLRIEPNAGITVVYDKDKRYIEQIPSSRYPFLLPADARYVRTSMKPTSVSGKYVYLGYEDMEYKDYYGGNSSEVGGGVKKTTKILIVGNSYSIDSFTHLYDICKSAGLNVIVGIAHNSGGSLQGHVDDINNNNTLHSYYKWSDAGKNIRRAGVLTKDAISDEEWDFIFFQQMSTQSLDYNTFQPHLNNLVSLVKGFSTNNQARYGINAIWSRSTTNGNVLNKETQIQMWKDICANYQRAAHESDLELLIPTGTAIQNARENQYLKTINDELTRDGSHLDLGIGRYITALTVFITIFGADVLGGTSFIPEDVNKYHVYLSKVLAQRAVTNPFNISEIEGVVV